MPLDNFRKHMANANTSQEELMVTVEDTITGKAHRRLSTIRVEAKTDKTDPVKTDLISIQPRGLPRDLPFVYEEYAIERKHSLVCPEGAKDEDARLLPFLPFRTASDTDNLHNLPKATKKEADRHFITLENASEEQKEMNLINMEVFTETAKVMKEETKLKPKPPPPKVDKPPEPPKPPVPKPEEKILPKKSLLPPPKKSLLPPPKLSILPKKSILPKPNSPPKPKPPEVKKTLVLEKGKSTYMKKSIGPRGDETSSSESESESESETSGSSDDDMMMMMMRMMMMMMMMMGMNSSPSQSPHMSQYGGYPAPGYGVGVGYPGYYDGYPPQGQQYYPQYPTPAPPPPKKKKVCATKKVLKKSQGMNFDFLPHDNCCTEVTLTIEPDDPDPLECAINNGIMPIVCCYMPPSFTLDPRSPLGVSAAHSSGTSHSSQSQYPTEASKKSEVKEVAKKSELGSGASASQKSGSNKSSVVNSSNTKSKSGSNNSGHSTDSNNSKSVKNTERNSDSKVSPIKPSPTESVAPTSIMQSPSTIVPVSDEPASITSKS